MESATQEAATVEEEVFSSVVWSSDHERRDCPRLSLERITVAWGDQRYEGCGDVSIGGALWMGEGPIEVGQRVRVSFELPGELEHYAAEAEVLQRRLEGKDVALHMRFAEIPFEVERAIARFVDEWRQAQQSEC